MQRADVAIEIRRYLATGDYDMLHAAWSGDSAIDRMRRGSRELLDALVAEAQRRVGTPEVPHALDGLDLAEFGRRKAEPVVRGLSSHGLSRTPCCRWLSGPLWS